MPKPVKRLKKKRKVAKPTTVDRAVDANGAQLKVGQRVRFDDALYTVETIRVVDRQEIVYFRAAEDGGLSQIHLPLVTIFDDGPPTTKKKAAPPKKRSLRSRLRSRRH